MTKLGVTHHSAVGGMLPEALPESWTRRYFVLTGAAELFYYKTRADFRADPIAARSKERGIQVDDYWVQVGDAFLVNQSKGDKGARVVMIGGSSSKHDSIKSGSSQFGGGGSSSSSSYGGDGGGGSFMITLESKEKEEGSRSWHLKTDTEEELEQWLETLQEFCPQSFR